MKKRIFTKQMAGAISLSSLAMGMIAAAQIAEAAQNVPFAQNISNTKHNLSNQRTGAGINGGASFGSGVGDIYTSGSGGTDGQAKNRVGSDQICVFCHTPHGANSLATAVPLWNRALGVSGAGLTTGYKAYSMVGSNSTGTAAVGGMSLACLSCHDGTQAMDAMFNAPGFGPGAGDGLSASGQTQYKWAAGTGDMEGRSSGFSGNNTVAGALGAHITWLGTDLSNDHPIGMLYCGGQTSGTCSDFDFKTATAGGALNTAKIGALKLFGTGAVADAKVECATCHDPHISDSGTASFLRVTPVASAICLTCHTK